ncbi:MAG: RsiG family protein [Nocardioidaceae bacterium]
MSSGGEVGPRLGTIVGDAVPLPELSLAQLRSYRRRLTDEEDRISYWRRLVHARIDVLEAERHHERPLELRELVHALGDTGAGVSRTALVTVRAADPLPDLPVLAEVWVPEVDPRDPHAVADALARLRGAEHQLGEYRHALHRRIDEATAELIGRYRADPTAALSALPRPRRRPGAGEDR